MNEEQPDDNEPSPEEIQMYQEALMWQDQHSNLQAD